MSTAQSVKTQIQSLIDSANITTGNNDATLTDAVDHLVEGFGQGGTGEGVDISKFGIVNEVTGTGIVTCDYVNENEHNVEVKLSSDTVTDFSGVKITKTNNNLFDISKFNSTNDFVNNGDGTITCKGQYPSPGANKISVCCPNIKVGQKIFISGNNITNVYFGNITRTVNGRNTSFTVTQEMLDKDNFAFYGLSNTTADNPLILSDIMINEGTEALPYEPYFVETYTANADGTVDGVTSISPVMNIICEGVDISAKYYQVPDVEWHRFWGISQNFGNRTDYSYGYSGIGWKKSNFKPKYNVIPLNAGYMFRDSLSDNTTENEMISMLELEKELGIIFDFSNCTNFDTAFRSSLFKEINVVDLKSTKSVNYTFYSTMNRNQQITKGTGLKRIERLVVHENIVFSNTTFNSNYILEYVGFEGVIANSITLQWCEILNVESAKKLLLCLKNYAGTSQDLVNTVTLHTNVWDALALEGNTSPNGNTWEQYVQDIGWNKG